MKHPAALLVLSFAVLAPFAAAPGTARMNYEDTGKPISWQGSLPQISWAPDGQHLLVREAGKQTWVDARTGAVREPSATAGADEGKEADAENGAEAGAEHGAEATKPRRIVMLHEGDLWLDATATGGGGGRGARGGRQAPGARGPSKEATRLTKDGAGVGDKEIAQLAPGERFASFVRGNDLYVVATGDQQLWRVTDDGGEELFHGKLDWVYQEEVYGRGDFRAHWWSPNGVHCAFLSLDEEPVREFTIVDHVPKGFLDEERVVHTEVANYPKSGDPNPLARMSVADAVTQKVTAIDLSHYPKDVLVMRVDWTPDGETLLLTLQDRIQTWAELCAVDPASGALTTWIREESPTWVNRPESPRWLDDGTFLWLSERTGYQHLYHYKVGGKLLAAVTSGDWQVRSIVRVDEAAKLLWFEGTQDGATGRHLYRVALAGGSAAGSDANRDLRSLTPGIGTHAFELAANGALVLDRWSAMDQPTVLRVTDGATGEVVRVLATADRGEGAAKYAFSERRRVTIPARDGYLLDACVQLPTEFEAGKRYPIYLPTYSGPDAPTVRDSWSHSTYNQFLCQQGFVILQVNVRSASGRGQVHTGTCYRRLGVQELQDLEDAVDHVCQQFGGDAKKVAISGWSYGGFMAAYALTHSKKFALGLAGAGVHDWRLYDTIYTERYMRTPQENAQGYDETSVIKAAKNLHGHLVLLHGTMDDNVHMQNSMQLIWELQKAGKQDFELMVYPRSRHGLAREVGAHSREFQWLRLQKLLD